MQNGWFGGRRGRVETTMDMKLLELYFPSWTRVVSKGSGRDFDISHLIDITGGCLLTMQGLSIVALWFRSEGWMAVWDGASDDPMSVLNSELELTSLGSLKNSSLKRLLAIFYFPTEIETWPLLLCLKECFLSPFVDPLWRTTTLTWKLLWDMVIWASLLTCRRQRQGTLDFLLATHTAP